MVKKVSNQRKKSITSIEKEIQELQKIKYFLETIPLNVPVELKGEILKNINGKYERKEKVSLCIVKGFNTLSLKVILLSFPSGHPFPLVQQFGNYHTNKDGTYTLSIRWLRKWKKLYKEDYPLYISLDHQTDEYKNLLTGG